MPRVINDSYEDVALNRLRPHERNANQGDFGAIQDSIQANGFYGAVVAQKSTGKILAGNHRYAVAQSEGLDTIPVIWVDVDDDEALRIMLADNRTSRLGIDDSTKLTALLAELAESETDTDAALRGTGYDGDDLDRLISDLARTGPIGLDSTQYTDKPQGQTTTPDQLRDNGRNGDGSLWAICPDCGHEFEVKNGRPTVKNDPRGTG